MRCLTSVRFNMVATVLNDYSTVDGVEQEVKGGHWETIQDEDTGAMTRRWVEDVTVVKPKNPGTSLDLTSPLNRFDIECFARGFPEVGFRSSANTEIFLNSEYRPFEVIQMVYPAKYMLNRSQYVTNIRDRTKRILWLEEETGLPTVFEVQGVTPSFDPFGRHIDNLAVLRRAAVQ